MKQIAFLSEGEKIAAVLRSPAGAATLKLPLVIIVPSWTNVKEQFASIYAEKLAYRGFHTMTLDFRFYGESGGQPRNFEDPESKIADIRNAVSHAITLFNVDADRIYVLGVCAGAGYAACAASNDSRIKKLVLVASWLHDSEAVKAFYGGEDGVASKIKLAEKARDNFNKTGVVDYAPKVSKTDVTAAMYGDFSYYLDPKRGAIAPWEADKFAVMSWDRWLKFSPLPAAKRIECPLLMIHSDGSVLPDYARQFFNDVTSKRKELYWTVGTQFDFYDRTEQVDEAVEKTYDFLVSSK